MTQKIIFGISGVIVGLAVGWLVFRSSAPILSGSVGVKLAENYDPYLKVNGGYYSALPIYTTASIQTGTAGTALTQVITGTCNLVGVGGDVIAKNGTVQASCATPGFVSSGSDAIFTDLSTSTGSVVAIGSNASSTSGYISVSLLNVSSSTAATVSGVGTSTSYLIIN